MPVIGLLLLFILVPLAELYLILEVVGPALGVVGTVVLLALDSLLGTFLLKSQGRSVWRRFQHALTEGRMPHREVVEGVLVIFGGAFLITPGFITDVVGILLLLPPTRAVFRRAIMRRLATRVGRAARDARRPPLAGDDVVDGSATEYDSPSPRLER